MPKLVELTQEQIAANDRLLAEREAAHMRAVDAYNRGEAVPSMDELITCVAVCEDCTIYPSQAEEFLHWGAFLGKFYRDYKGLIKQHQIFRRTSAMIQESEVYVEFRQSLRDEDEPKLVNVTKSNWVGKEDHEHEGVAFDHRPDEMQEQSIPAVKLAPLNPYKQFEMWSK
jgi:hypothetical protein